MFTFLITDRDNVLRITDLDLGEIVGEIPAPHVDLTDDNAGVQIAALLTAAGWGSDEISTDNGGSDTALISGITTPAEVTADTLRVAFTAALDLDAVEISNRQGGLRLTANSIEANLGFEDDADGIEWVEAAAFHLEQADGDGAGRWSARTDRPADIAELIASITSVLV